MKPQGSQPGTGFQPHGFRFKSFFMAGFECSTHRLRSGRRLDMIAATQHEKFAAADYRRLQRAGLKVAREGVRWHLVEAVPGRYDFSSVLPVVRAVRESGTQVLWDLCHFGWPDHLDVFSPEFVEALAAYGAAFADWLDRQTGEPAIFVPVNEISFFSWAAGDEGTLFPFATGRGFELKVQLVRAALEAMNRIWAAHPHTSFVHVDPIIHVVADPRHPEEAAAAEAYRLLQFQAWDMLSGRIWPELGGHGKYLDTLGVNFYPHNQWFYNLRGFHPIRKFTPILRRHPQYRPFRELLREVHERYRRPVFVAETGAENRLRPGWLRYVCSQSEQAIRAGTPVLGICLYPILNHPGWTDERHCRNALWDYPDASGNRKTYEPLAHELKLWQARFGNALAGAEGRTRQQTFPAAAVG